VDVEGVVWVVWVATVLNEGALASVCGGDDDVVEMSGSVVVHGPPQVVGIVDVVDVVLVPEMDVDVVMVDVEGLTAAKSKAEV